MEPHLYYPYDPSCCGHWELLNLYDRVSTWARIKIYNTTWQFPCIILSIFITICYVFKTTSLNKPKKLLPNYVSSMYLLRSQTTRFETRSCYRLSRLRLPFLCTIRSRSCYHVSGTTSRVDFLSLTTLMIWQFILTRQNLLKIRDQNVKGLIMIPIYHH